MTANTRPKIDDQQCIRQLISEELILEGHQVCSLGDAESVREHLQLFQTDLVLLDLFLDGPDGFGVFEDIKYRHIRANRNPAKHLSCMAE